MSAGVRPTLTGNYVRIMNMSKYWNFCSDIKLILICRLRSAEVDMTPRLRN